MPRASAAGVRLSLRFGGGHIRLPGGGGGCWNRIGDQFAALLPDRPAYDPSHPLGMPQAADRPHGSFSKSSSAPAVRLPVCVDRRLCLLGRHDPGMAQRVDQGRILYRGDTRLAKRQRAGDRRGSAVIGGFVLIAARCLRLGARGALDKAGDRLAGFGVHPQERAELGAGDARIPDQGEQLHLILQ